MFILTHKSGYSKQWGMDLLEATVSNNLAIIRGGVRAVVMVMNVVSREVVAVEAETGVVCRKAPTTTSSNTHQPQHLGEAGVGGTGEVTGTILTPGLEVVTAGDTNIHRYDRDTVSDRDIKK